MRTCFVHKLKFFIIIGVVICLFAAVFQYSALAEEPVVLRVAFPEVEGFSVTDPDGSKHGIVVDYLNEISKYTGWQYEYIPANSDYLVEQFLDGEYDLMGCTYYSPDYEQYFAYPDYNCGHTKSLLLARYDDNSIKSYDERDLDGKTIGVFKNAKENIRRLQEFLSISGVSCTLKYYEYEDFRDGSLYCYLENGEVDLLLGNSADLDSRYRIVTSLDAQPHYIVTSPEKPEILEGLNMALERIVESNPNFADECYAANFPDVITPKLFLNNDELAYIERKKNIVVAVPEGYHPLTCFNISQGSHQGIAIDFLEEVTAFSGLSFTLTEAPSYIEALEMVQQGRADVMVFFLGNEDQASQMGLALSKPYVSINDIVVRNKFVSYPSDGLVCALLEGRKLPSNIRADEIQYYSNEDDALAAVNRGQADFAYGLSPRLENGIQRKYLSNVVPVTLLNSNSQISFALKKNADMELLTIINKTINQLHEEEKNTITNRNMISGEAMELSLVNMIYANPVLVLGIVSCFLLMALLVILFISYSRVRAATMRAELEKAEAESKAKSTFLSRMSHEIRTPMNAVIGLADLTSMMEQVPEEVQANLAKIRGSSRYLLSLINDILDMSRIDNGMLAISEEPFSLLQMLDELQSMMGVEAGRQGLNFKADIQVHHSVLLGDSIRLRQVLTNLISNAIKFTSLNGNILLSVIETDFDGLNTEFEFKVIDDGIGISHEDQERIFSAFEQAGTSSSRSQGTGLGLPISSSLVRLMGSELKLKSAPGQGSEFYFTAKFPCGVLPVRQEMPLDEGFLNGVRILLTEDNELNAEIASELLKMKGAEIDYAVNGKAAVKKFSESEPGEIRLILMDIQMPEMNGLEAAKAIRSMDRPDAAEIPIIAMTANSFQEDIDAAFESGMNYFVTKPLDIKYLYKVLQNVLSGEKETGNS